MKLQCKACGSAISLFIVVAWLVPGAARAGDPPAAAAATQPATEPAREQSIYIPYAKLRETFEREGRGVFLPYEQFQELWRAAREATRKPPEEGPPVKTLITEVSSDATVARDVVRVKAQVRLEVLAEGWHEIPLGLADAAITAATVGGQPARIVGGGDQGYRLLLEKKGAALEQVELVLEYAKAFTKAPGQNTVSFDAPRAPVSKWRVRIPQAGVKINIHPLIAASEVPVGDPDRPQADETVVLAFVGAAPAVRIDWTPRAEGAQGLQALVAVQTVQRVWIDEGVVRTRVNLAYDITRAAVSKLVLEAPADQKVVNVFDANVRQWSVEAAGDVQKITAELFEPAQGTQNILVELEQFGRDQTRSELAAPVVRALDVSRQQGLVAVAVGEGLRVEPVRRSGLLQVDAGEMPKSATSGPAGERWSLTYRYVTLPYELALRVDKIEPRITADALVDVLLEPEELTMHVQAVYTVERAGVFRLELALPAGYEVRSVRGADIKGVAPAVVESHHLTEGEPRRLVVNLGRKALGQVGLAVNLHKRLTEADLLQPTGKAAELSIGVPQLAGPGMERVTGRLIIYPAESLRVTPGQLQGLRVIPLAEALQGAQTSIRGGPPETRTGGLAFAFADEPAAAALKAERRKPHITVRQLLAARVESGVVKYEATFFYNILYSAVPSLRIDIPQELAGVVQNPTIGVRDARLESPAEAPAAGYVAWGYRGEAGFKGQPTIKLTWERKIDALEIGKSVDVLVPQLRPMEVDRAWGQIALAKAETIDIRATGGAAAEKPVGLRPIDPQRDLLAGGEALRAEGVARAFEFHDNWVLGVTATRYQLEEVKRTSIERALVRMVATRRGEVSAQALYRIRSAHQRLAVQLPDNVAFDTEPVRINGRPVALERGQKGEYFVPLVGQSPDQPFVLEVRYTVPGGGTRLVCPDFPDQPAVQKVYLEAYLPPEWVYLGSRGPWTDELEWRWDDVQGFQPLVRRDDLLPWVVAGINVAGNPAESFQTDGRPYLFSSMGPAPGRAGVLRLVTLRERWLHAFVLIVVALLGVALLWAKTPTRLLALGAFVTALILLGVFLPTFLRQIVDGVLLSALALVAILWLVWYLAWTRPRDPNVIARRAARQAPKPPSGPPAPAAPSPAPARAAPPSGSAGGPSHA